MTPQALHQRRMKAEGRCVRCGKPNDAPTTRCDFCAARDNAQFRSRRAILRALGRCLECHKDNDTPAFTRCFPCRLKHAQRDRDRRARCTA